MSSPNVQRLFEKLIDEIINGILVVGSFIAVIVYLLSLSALRNVGFEPSIVTDFIVVLIVVLITIFRKKIPVQLKSVILVTAICISIFIDLFEIGVLSANKSLIVLLPLFLFLSVTVRKAIVFLGVFSLGILGLGYLHITRFLEANTGEPNSFEGWTINFLIIFLGTYILGFALHKLKKAFKELSEEVEELKKMKKK